MHKDFRMDDTELCNSYHRLGPQAQRELKDYVDYLLTRQYKREVIITVFHNKLLKNRLCGLLHIVESEEPDINLVKRRVIQVKELYFGLFEKVHSDYAQLVEDLDACEVVKEFGRTSFTNLMRAIDSNRPSRVRTEVIDFFQGFDSLSRHSRARKIIAV